MHEETTMTIRVVLGILALTVGGLAGADDKVVDLKVGDAAPVFEGSDDQGGTWKSADRVGKRFVVVYFYPGDFTPGCTKQAQNFRDSMNSLQAKGVEVVGISGDSVKTHEMFKKAQKLNFTLLGDETGALATKFGVPVGKGGQVRVKVAAGEQVTLKRAVTLARWTFVIGKDGKIAYKNTKVNPAQDTKQVTELIDKLIKKDTLK
jgi:peroxiredoxin Q/BCP